MELFKKDDIVKIYKDVLETSNVKQSDVVIVGDAAMVLYGLKETCDKIEMDVSYNAAVAISPNLKVDKFKYIELGFGVWLRNKKHYAIFTFEVEGVITLPKNKLTLGYLNDFINPNVDEDEADDIFDTMADILENMRIENLNGGSHDFKH